MEWSTLRLRATERWSVASCMHRQTPTRRQIEGGFLGTLASIGIPMAISLVSKMFGSGLQVDRDGSSNTANVYVPHPPPPTHGEGYPYHLPPPFLGTWKKVGSM